jgi:Asp-tRNA(Asn)/Glu-tRNA(Gln) amidotransferase A subunit family amidase
MSVHGPLARDVRDVALLLSGMVGDYTLDPYAQSGDPAKFRDIPHVDLAALRVGLSFGLGGAPVSQAIRQVFERNMKVLSTYVSAVEWTEPEFPDVHPAYEIYRGLHYFNRSLLYLSGEPEKFTDRFDELHPNVQDNFRRAESITAEQVAWALEIQTKVFQSMAHHMKRYDVVITPVCSVSPFPTSTNYPTEIDGKPMELYTTWTGTTYVVAMTLHPTVALPCGLDQAGLPFGIQVIGRYRDERRLLGIACALEAAFEQTEQLKKPRVNIGYLASQGS